MRVPTILALLLPLLGCGGGSRASERSSSPTAHASSSGSTSTRARHPALAPLRPPGADAALAALEADPPDAEGYARAALFYAGTDAAGMALVYGLSYAAMEPRGARREELGVAMARVLAERITITSDGATRRVATSLAPGAMPAIAAADGSLSAPIAHLFELQMGPALARVDGQWTLASIVAVWTSYVALLGQQASPFAAGLELHRWLLDVEGAGHLEAFVTSAFGPAFPDERAQYESSHEGAIAASDVWIAAHPLRPTRGVMPDDLARIR